MEDELSTDAIGISPRSEPGDVSKQDETINMRDPSVSVITLTSQETGCSQTNNQCQSETLKKPFQSEDTSDRNDNKLLSSDELRNHDDRIQNVRNACELGHDHPTLSEEFEVNSESTEPKIKPPKEVKQTHDKNVCDQALFNLKLPSEHLGTNETCCPQTNIQSQSETLENTFQSVNTNVIRDENNLHLNHNDKRPNISTAVEFRHDHPKMAKEFEIHSESTIPEIKSQEEVEQTYDNNALDQATSNLRLPPEPPLEWRLNELLDDIAMEITDSEFKRIKLLFTGPESLGEALLTECDTCIKLFTVLKEKKYISRDNILYLNKILYILMRKDLIKRTVEYCLEEGNVIHYYSFDGEPGIGKRYVKIHVVADIQYYNKESLDKLRNYVARIVCAPIEVVKIYAVEPGSSLMITFTMPDIYVDVLKDLLQGKVNLRRLSSLQVDIVIVDDVHYDVSGNTSEKMVPEQYNKIKNVYEQLNDKGKELEQLEITHLKRLEELNNLKLQLERTKKLNHELSTTCSMLQKMHLTFSVTETALSDFQSLMQEASEKGQDMELVHNIIKSNTEITAAYYRSMYEIKLEGLTLKLKEMQTRDEMFQHTLGQLMIIYGKDIGKYLLKMCNPLAEFQKEKDEDENKKKLNLQLIQPLTSKSKSPEEIVLSYAEQLNFNGVMSVNNTLLTVSATFCVKLMTKKSRGLILFLNEEECTKLLNTCTWYDQDAIKECIQEDKRLLLPGVLCKEIEREGTFIPPEEVIIRLQEETNRKDLLGLFRQLKTDEKQLQAQIDLWQERQKKEPQLLQMLSTGQTSAEEVLLQKFQKFTFKLADDVETDPDFEELTKRLGELSGKVNKIEYAEIMELYKWDENDIIKACITADKRLLFEGIWFKDMEITQKITLLDSFLSNICQIIKKTDLFDEFEENIDETLLLNVIDKLSEYFFNSPNVHKVLQKNANYAG